jgi:chromosome segregation ATPase
MIPPIHKWYPMVQPEGYPNRTDALERRAERLEEEYKQALKMHKVKNKIDDLEVELYNKRFEQHKLSIEIFQNRKVDILV